MNHPTPAIRSRMHHKPTVIPLHRLSTRLRLGVPALRQGDWSSPALVTAVEAVVLGMEGVTKVEANSVTGSLLVEHDGAPGREAAILSALYDQLPSSPSPGAEQSRLLSDFRRAGTSLNQASLRASGGWVDLRTALPLLLGIYGLSRLLTERPFRSPSGLTMVWWAYTSLRQLARESRR